MAVLFSCIGITDPIMGNHDGPMLHIVRQYEDITTCYLFLTKQMIERDERNYYDMPLKHLASEMKREIEIHKFKTEITKANDFNEFYDIFIEKLNEIREQHPEEKIYVNVTSATPQMLATLMIILSQDRYKNIYAIQVDNHDPGKSPKREIDIEKEIKENIDNVDSVDRTKEVKFLVMQRNQAIEKIKQLLDIYEYSTLKIVAKNSYVFNGKSGFLIDHMIKRTMFDFENAKKHLDLGKLDEKEYLPYYSNKDKNALLEYYINLKNLAKKPQLNEFVIRLMVLAVELQKLFIKAEFNIDVERDFYNKKTKKYEATKDNELKKYLEGQSINTETSELTIWFLNAIIEYYAQVIGMNDQRVFETFKLIDAIRRDRNIAAHQLEIITRGMINEKKDINLLVNDIRYVIKYIYKDVNDDYFNIYDKINEEIKSEL